MVEEIYKMKNEILQQAKKELEERGPERIDVNRMGAMVDMVKDLAEAEEKCWKAQYYRNAVTEAMESKYGYGSTGSPANGGNMSRMGYSDQKHDDIVEKLGEEYKHMSPEERMMMRSKVLTKLGSM